MARTFPIKRKRTDSGQNNGLSYAMSSMQGWRHEMEDTHNIRLSINAQMEDWAYAGVFDGHSGKKASKYASKNLLDKILEQINEINALDPTHEDIERHRLICKGISSGFVRCDKAMEESGSTNDDSGTTAVCALISPTHFYVANCGDSRAILCRNGKVQFATRDHKPDLKVEKNRIEKAGGYVRKHRVVGRLAMSRALGDFEVYKRNPAKPQLQQMVIPKPDVTSIMRDNQTDEFLVLACDGVFDVMSNYELITYIRTQMAQTDNLTVVCNRVVDHCLEKKSTDNISIIIITLPGCPSQHVLRAKRKADFAKIKNAKRPKPENNAAHAPLSHANAPQSDEPGANDKVVSRKKPVIPNPFIQFFLERWRLQGGKVCEVAKACGEQWKQLRKARKDVYNRRYLKAKRRLAQ